MVISIIVTVYKVKDFLPCCLDSIIAQTFQDWECLLIDDGSPDGSALICDAYALRDHRFKVIHKLNGGVSAARQTGVDIAKGEYVIHVDADDWIEPNYLELLYNKAAIENADMVICDYYEDSAGKSTLVTQQLNCYEHMSVLKDMFAGKIYGCNWNKLVRRSAIHNSNAKFPIGVNHCEDGIFNAQLLLTDIKIVHLGIPLYHYRRGINTYSILATHSSLYEVYVQRNKVLFSILTPVVPQLVDRLKFQLKYLGYAEMRPWREYRDCYSEINDRLEKEPYECSRMKALTIHYTVKYKCLYTLCVILRKIKNRIREF